MKHKKTDPKLVSLIQEREPEANWSISNILILIGLLYMVVFLLTLFHVYECNMTLSWISLFSNALSLFVVSLICILRRGKDKWIKYMFVSIMLISALEIQVFTGYKAWMIFAIPVVISIRYFDKYNTIYTGLFSAVLILACGICNAFLMDKIGLVDMNVICFKSPVTLEVHGYLYSFVIGANPDKIQTMWNSIRILVLPNLLMIGVITLISAFIVSYCHTLMMDVYKSGVEKNRLELEIADNRSKIMMSQIQPHFLYNALSAIMAIDGNPDETVDALGEFGKYLRENLDSLSQNDIVPFTKEMEHVMHYVTLEKLRFKDKIHILWNTEETSFLLPALSLQMLVENAIKHGITMKDEGGTITITSSKTEDEYLIRVEDDGVGFDVNGKPEDAKSHVGLENVRQRVEHLCNGSLIVTSEIGKGSIITIHLPKEEGK